MRRFGPLIVIIILCLLGGVGATYYSRLKLQASTAPPKPRMLPNGTNAAARDWTYTKMNGNVPAVFVKAKDYKYKEAENKMELTGVELHLFHKDAKEYDLVQSASAELDEKSGELYSDGEVDITMHVPADQPPSGRLMSIKTSGVHLDTKTGRAATDRPASFAFDRGDGKGVGAEYDPNSHELQLKSAAELNWRGTGPNTKVMTVTTDNVVYKEREAKVFLSPWSKLVRDTLTLNAGPATVTLKDGLIQNVETTNAQGTERQEKRTLDYAAGQLTMLFDDSGGIQKITGVQNAHLISTSDAGQTTMTSDRVDMDFDTSTKDSILKTAVANGHSIVESKPAIKPGTKPEDAPDTRILKSDVIVTKMRPGGQEIDAVETESPAGLEFVPATAAKPHRWMNGERIWITYGPHNAIETFRSVSVSTKTIRPKQPGARQDPAPAFTGSTDMLASFDPKTSQLARMEQWGAFHYEEGDRKATADKAVLDQPKNLIDLIGAARVWDPTGSTAADRILLDQKSGDFTAEGKVQTMRMPDKKGGESAGMLSNDEPLHARAKKMASTDNNLKVRYEGNVFLWQGANRLQADIVEIDRDNDIVKAHGNVVSQLMDKQDDDKDTTRKGAKTAPPVFTIVHAPDLIYTDDDRLAYYKGGVTLDRGTTRVRSKELKAFLRDDSNDSSLDHAFADGAVQIVQTAPDRTRTGTSEHAEYFVDDDKVVLEGGQPKFVDSLRGVTQGRQLVWFSDEDKLIVNGAIGHPAQSSLRRKKETPASK